ncbi:hypothetical protein BGLA2_310045 [Burkholderia gladioli]|nr:hypothetical protein BGLA2_310045 [Burkholderia gladioli]
MPTFNLARQRRQLPKYNGHSIDHIGWLEAAKADTRLSKSGRPL